MLPLSSSTDFVASLNLQGNGFMTIKPFSKPTPNGMTTIKKLLRTVFYTKIEI